jgi:hypothetical protein
MGNIDEVVRNAYGERRRGDKPEEVEAIREYIRSAEVIVVPTTSKEKVKAINSVLKEFGIAEAKQLDIKTDFADLTRMPAVFKALAALDVCECDLVIARGRLGVPGSGAMLVVVDAKGRILTAALSPPHVIHNKSVEEAVKDEMTHALRRLGF